MADALDTMTSSRTYQAALPLGEARRRIVEGKGAWFDPRVVDALEHALDDGTLTLLPSYMREPVYFGTAERAS